MNRKKTKLLGILLCIVLLACLVIPKSELSNTTAKAAGRTKLKKYTISNRELKKIATVAKKSGSRAADEVNELKGNDFKAAVNKVLTTYYENNEKEQLKDFENSVNKEADSILNDYKEAAKERENADELSYEAGYSLVSFGADVTEEEIKAIVKDQYGECEYIHKNSDGTYLVKVKNSLGFTVEKAVKAYGTYNETIHTAKNDRVEQLTEAQELVNDPFAADQYYLRNMNVVDTWKYIRTVNHSKVKVAVIDGGADMNCVDLRASSGLSAEILSDGSSIPLSQSTQQYINMHGINVAGVIGATANNGSQIAGVASCINNDVVDLINIKIEMYVDKIAVGLDYALRCNAKVVNLSLAHEGANDVEKAAIDRFVAAGGTVVSGAGNNGSDVECYPSDYANTISVISVDANYTIAGTSNRGWKKDICAPGVNIYAPGPGDTTYITGGTSLASPMVAGVVTMMYSVNPGLNSDTVRKILIDTARDIGETGRDYTYAYGFVNAYSAVLSAAGQKPEETTTVNTMPGYVAAAANWTELSYWSVYFASGWANEPTGRYKDGKSYNDFGVYIDKASGVDWGIQLKTKQLDAVAGNKYTCKIKVNSNMATSKQIRFKEENSEAEKLYILNSGANELELTFTSKENIQLFLDLGQAPQGLKFDITSFELVKNTAVETTTPEPTTRTFDAYDIIEAEHFTANEGGVIDTNSNASGGHNIGGINNGVIMEYDNVTFGKNAGGICICYSSPKSVANGKAEIYVDSMDNKVGTVELPNNAASWADYGEVKGKLDREITAGKHKVYIKYVTTSTEHYVANIDYCKFIPASEYIKTIDGGIEINGFQINSSVNGMRTVYSVDSQINGVDVVSSGVVYSLSDFTKESDTYVKSIESTEAKGMMPIVCSESDIAKSYAMTMQFVNQSTLEWTTTWKIKAYAELSDGTYVYTDVVTYKIYDIADELYKKCSSNNETAHRKLFENILFKVDKTYTEIEFKSDIVK